LIPIYRGAEKDQFITKARKDKNTKKKSYKFRVFVVKKIFDKMQRNYI